MDPRPISVTSILPIMTQIIIVRMYLWPSLRGEMTVSIGTKLTKHVACSYISNAWGRDYARCFLKDYSQAFEAMNHVLIGELNRSVFAWIRANRLIKKNYRLTMYLKRLIILQLLISKIMFSPGLFYIQHQLQNIRWVTHDDLLLAEIITAFIHLPPENAAVDIGSDIVILNCTSNVSILGWSFQAPGSTSSEVVTIGCSIQSPTSCPYAVNTSGALDCQLIITSASPACAGTYICQDAAGTGTSRSAMVIVLGNT